MTVSQSRPAECFPDDVEPSLEEPVAGRNGNSRGVTRVGSCLLPTRYGRFVMDAYEVEGVPVEFIALTLGDLQGDPPPLVRLHSECLTGDVLGSLRCDCGEQLTASLETIAREDRGLLLYLRQEGRGIGLVNKIRAYELQDGGLDTVDANLALGLPVDAREYRSAASVLKKMGVNEVRLITNNVSKIQALSESGVKVRERVPLIVPPNSDNISYLQTKARRLGHLLDPRNEGSDGDDRT